MKLMEIDKNLINIFELINILYNISIYDKNILEIGIGTGIKTINMAKLFKNYYAIENNKEKYDILLNLCKNNNSNIETYNIDYDKFIKSSSVKFDLIYLENFIHFVEIDKFIDKFKNLNTRFILIKNRKAKPYGWYDKTFCINSSEFKEKRWINFREILKNIYSKLSNHKFLINKFTNIDYHYFLLEIKN